MFCFLHLCGLFFQRLICRKIFCLQLLTFCSSFVCMQFGFIHSYSSYRSASEFGNTVYWLFWPPLLTSCFSLLLICSNLIMMSLVWLCMFIQLGACWESWINAFVIIIRLDNFQLLFFFQICFLFSSFLGLKFILISPQATESHHWLFCFSIFFLCLTLDIFYYCDFKSSDFPFFSV